MSEHPFAVSMRHAVALAERGRFAVHPNPMVGAVLVHNGRVVAGGWHKAYGAAHAEVDCLEDAARRGVNPAECTLVVTLEPCHHQGKTPPCTKAIVEAGIKHVVIGVRDKNPIAAGGLEFLQSQGIHVELGIEEQLCADVIADFLVYNTTNRPYVILKMATTLDGRIATRTGHSKWISGKESRATVHTMRHNIARCGGAVMVGGGTFRDDNPHLTARLSEASLVANGGAPIAEDVQPLACVVTSRLPMGSDAYLLQNRPHETLFFTTPAAAASPTSKTLQGMGVRVWSERPSGTSVRLPSLHTLLERLRTELECPYVLCEGGGKLALSLLEEGLVDEFLLHMAPCVLGDDEARPAFHGRNPLQMTDALQLRMTKYKPCGADLHLTLRPTRSAVSQQDEKASAGE